MNATISPAVTPTPTVSQRSVVAAEWIKLRTVRSNVVGLAAAAGVLVLLGVLFSSLAGSSEAAGPPTRGGDDALTLSLAGMNLSQLVLGVLGAVFVTGEYATGLIRTTFGAVAQRTPVLWGKAIVFGGTTWIAMTIASFAAFFGGQAVFGGDTGTYALSDPGVLRVVLGSGLYGAGIAVMGLALGFIVRSTATAIGILVTTLMIAPVLIGLLPSGISDPVAKVLPSNAGSAFTTLTASSDLLSPTGGLLVFTVWVIGLLSAAAVMLRRRDA